MLQTVNVPWNGLMPGETCLEDIAPTIAGLLGVKLAKVDGTQLQPSTAPYVTKAVEAS
jgi:hypothetical protein